MGGGLLGWLVVHLSYNFEIGMDCMTNSELDYWGLFWGNNIGFHIDNSLRMYILGCTKRLIG